MVFETQPRQAKLLDGHALISRLKQMDPADRRRKLGFQPVFQQSPSRAESLIGASNARQQGAHMLPGLPRAGTIRGVNTISPGLLCPAKITSISQDCA